MDLQIVDAKLKKKQINDKMAPIPSMLALQRQNELQETGEVALEKTMNEDNQENKMEPILEK